MGNVKKNQWFLAIKERGQDLFDLSGLTIIPPPEGAYYADPFLFRNLIFFEYYNYDKGVIACMNKKGKQFKIVLERPYHLSFPFIIEDAGEVYMIPERGAGNIELYRAVDFPDKWEFVKTLAEGAFADTTIIKNRNSQSYLMFTTEGDNNLRIYQAESIGGPWEMIHAESYMHSRGAGNIFKHEGKLIRPTQDGEVYGRKVFFKEISMPYKEKTIGEVNPDLMPGLTGVHTFNFDDTHVIIDMRKPL